MDASVTPAGLAAEAGVGQPLRTREKVSILIGVMFGMLLASLDQTIVGTAMPRVIAELGGLDHYAWVFTSYSLASTVLVPIYGKLSDLYGRRPFFIGGMLLFLLGSALSGMSQNMVQLILFRAVQGLGAGAMMPIAIAIIGDVFPPAERGKWQGLLMAVFGLSSIVGPTLGGWLTDSWGWRWVFYVNMPVGAVALIAAILTLPKHQRTKTPTIDYLGSALLVLGTVPLLLALSWAGTEYAWSSPLIIGLLAFAAVVLAAFCVVEVRSPDPIINPQFFRNSIFSVSIIAVFLTSIGMFGTIMYLPLFVQGVIGATATDSGAVLTPLMLGFITSSIISGQILSRTGRYKIMALIGFFVAAGGMWLLWQMNPATTTSTVVRNMIITGLGIGVMMSLFTIVVQNAFPAQRMGQVTSNLQFFRSIGGTLGVAVLGSVMNSRFHGLLANSIPPVLVERMSAEQLAALQNPQVLFSAEATAALKSAFAAFGPQGDALFGQLMVAVRQSLATSITDIFLVGMIVMVLGFTATLFLREIPLRKSHHSVTSDLAAAVGE